jgi:hypothetical protein
MSLEPGLADLVDAAMIVAPDWGHFRACPICKAPPGKACTAMFSAVRDGRPDGPPKVLSIAHGYRKRRRGQ